MEGLSRKPFQGITNIIRFNWHFYVIALIWIVVLIFSMSFLPESLTKISTLLLGLTLIGISFSLITSYYVYDCSNLYTLDWLKGLSVPTGAQLVNINAGFDETSILLKQKFPDSTLTVLDFYDPTKHTEVSIERARKAYSAFHGTKTIRTDKIPLKENSIDYIFLVLAAHEIREEEERIVFFQQLGSALKTEGKIIVVEHQRDLYNFIAYTIGFLHFFSTNTWKKTFHLAELTLLEEFKITPFISTFILKKNGITS